MQPKQPIIQLLICLFCCLSMGICLADDAIIAAPRIAAKPIENAEVKAPESAKSTETMNEVVQSGEQYLYESNLQHAVIAYSMLKNMWPLKFPRQALKNKTVFTENEAGILSTHSRTLLSNDAALREYDFPEMYVLWAEAANMMDEAESLKLYTPPADLANALAAWRMKKQIDAATLQAAWILGPSEVVIDANVAPIVVPAGFKFLHKADLFALENQLYEIKQVAITQNNLKFPLRKPDAPLASVIAPVVGNWTASIAVINNRYVDFDGNFINDEMAEKTVILETIKSRLEPSANMRFDTNSLGSYNKSLVNWLIVPKRDMQTQSMQWAMTDGAATKALGINYAFIKLGKNQQVIMVTNFLQVAHSLSHSEYLPEGKTKADYLPENVLAPVMKDLKPMLDSINFKQGFQLQDANEQDKLSQVSLQTLMVPGPTIMEQGIKRIMAEDERKSNFWLFLKDHPRYQGTLFSALAMLYVAIRTKDSELAPENFFGRLLVIASKLIGIAVLVAAAMLVWINFFLE
jgi:hypothetical protein